LISIAAPIIEQEEIDAVHKVLESGVLAQGPRVAELEAAFAAYCGTKYAVAVNSGTAALHAALFAAGVGPGDEVITVPFSFIATINPIIFLGATPVLVDIEPETFNMDVRQVEAAITSKTKAIMPVHLYGQPADCDELRAIAKKHNLVIIEDACQAIGAAYGDKKAGSLGDMGCFSLYATKNIMCGEGGMITTDNKEYVEAMKRFRQHGMSGPYQYEHVGYNYRMTDLLATVATVQLSKVDDFNSARQTTAVRLTEGLADIPGIVLPVARDGRTHVYHQYTIRLTSEFPVDRQTFLDSMKERGIIAGVYYAKPLHVIPHIARYGYSEHDFPESIRAAAEVVSLPVHPRVSEADAVAIVNAVKEIAHV